MTGVLVFQQNLFYKTQLQFVVCRPLNSRIVRLTLILKSQIGTPWELWLRESNLFSSQNYPVIHPLSIATLVNSKNINCSKSNNNSLKNKQEVILTTYFMPETLLTFFTNIISLNPRNNPMWEVLLIIPMSQFSNIIKILTNLRFELWFVYMTSKFIHSHIAPLKHSWHYFRRKEDKSENVRPEIKI